MKKLENYGVQELNTQEVRETQGGVWWSKATTWFAGLSYVFDVGGIRTVSASNLDYLV